MTSRVRENIAKNVEQQVICQSKYVNSFMGKSGPKFSISNTSVIIPSLTKENNRHKGENSPNLVALTRH
jgi:hypothetical protein